MNKLKNIVVFGVIPVFIVALLYINAELQAKKYENKTVQLKQYDAQIISEKGIIYAGTEEDIELPVSIKNLGTMAWVINENESINLSYHILKEDNSVVIREGLRTHLSRSVRSGESIELLAQIKAPSEVGIYYVELDMVHESVTWFGEKGSQPFKIKLEVK